MDERLMNGTEETVVTEENAVAEEPAEQTENATSEEQPQPEVNYGAVIYKDMWSYMASLKAEEPNPEPDTQQIPWWRREPEVNTATARGSAAQPEPEQKPESEPEQKSETEQKPEPDPQPEHFSEEGAAKKAVVRPKGKVMLHHGIVLLVGCAIVIFGISNLLAYCFGTVGTFLSEVLLLVLALLTVRWAYADWKPIFQFRKIRGSQIGGTVLLWIGTYLIAMFVTILIELFFPTQMMETASGLNSTIASIPLLEAIFVVAATPAICEEAVFRGVFYNSVWNKSRNKWVTILVTAAVFGMFHGSVWRFFPTCILGIAMGFLIFETNNFIYNMLFHFINNLVPILLIYALNSSVYMSGTENYSNYAQEGWESMIAAVGLYLMLAALGVFLVYAAIYLLRKGRPGYRSGLFPPEKRKKTMILFAVCGCMAVMGFLIIIFGIVLNLRMALFGY